MVNAQARNAAVAASLRSRGGHPRVPTAAASTASASAWCESATSALTVGALAVIALGTVAGIATAQRRGVTAR